MFLTAALLLSLVAAAQAADTWPVEQANTCCQGYSFADALTNEGGSVLYALGVPVGSSQRTVTTTGGASATLFDFRLDQALNAPSGDGTVASGTVTVVMPREGDCGATSVPFAWDVPQMLRLDADTAGIDLSDRAAFEVAPDNAIKPRSLPSGAPSCSVAGSSFGGKCISQSECVAPYVKFSWYNRAENGVDDGCRSFKPDIMCCALPKGYSAGSAAKLPVQDRVFLFHAKCDDAARSPCVQASVATGTIDETPQTDMCPNAGIINQRCKSSSGEVGRCSSECHSTAAADFVARTGCCDALPGAVKCCLDRTIPAAQPAKASCFNLAESRAVLTARQRLDNADAVILNMPKREGCTCKNDGVCNAGGLCVCPIGFGGKECEEVIPPPPEFAKIPSGEKIVPGFEGNDVWTIGGRRTIEFQVEDYASSQTTQNVEVWLVNTRTSVYCGTNRDQVFKLIQSGVDIPPHSPISHVFSIKVGTVNLRRASNGASSFKAQIDFDLTGDPNCVAANHDWRVYIQSVEEPREGPWANGANFKVEYAGCVAENGQTGECMSKGTCSSTAVDRLYGYSPQPIKFGQCGVQAECCVPDHTPDPDDPFLSWFIFTSPTSDDRAPYLAHSLATIEWKHKTGSKGSWVTCSASDEANISLKLFKQSGWLSDDLLATNAGSVAVTDRKKEVKLEGLSEGTYYWVAEFEMEGGDGCQFKSTSFRVVNPGCQGDPTTTISGSCVKQGSCIEDAPAEASGCDGLYGAVECCKPKRGAFSPNFRGTEGTLGAGAAELSLSVAVALAAAAAL